MQKSPMFRLKKPCDNCPFVMSAKNMFGLTRGRLTDIFEAPAFQCHKTVDYSSDDEEGRSGDKPAQCAGLIALHYKEQKMNQITQVAVRLIGYNPATIDSTNVFASYEDCINYHDLRRLLK